MDLDITSNAVVDYFKSLYAASPPDEDFSFCNLIPSIVTDDDNNSLTKAPSESEITNAVFSMDPTSSLGPDGFLGFFFF